MWKKSDNKKTPQELQEYLAFRKRGHKVNDKTKYNRKKKHRSKDAAIGYVVYVWD